MKVVWINDPDHGKGEIEDILRRSRGRHEQTKAQQSGVFEYEGALYVHIPVAAVATVFTHQLRVHGIHFIPNMSPPDSIRMRILMSMGFSTKPLI